VFFVPEPDSNQLPPLEKRPLVTFALLAYNQEKFIREAIEGAFSQTYEPLEIIISDDCSTDRTFDIIKDLSNKYTGPHKIIINKNETNAGLINHVNLLFERSIGEYSILAAGDDVSPPDRVSLTTSEFLNNNSLYAVHSNALKINENGTAIDEWVPPIIKNKTKKLDIANANAIHIGATAAYKKSIYDIFGPINNRDTYEDLALGFRAYLLNGIGHINTCLVKYRYNIGISSELTPSYNDTNQRLKSIIHRTATLQQWKCDCEKLQTMLSMKLVRLIDIQLIHLHARQYFYQDPKKLISWLFSRRAKPALHAISSEVKYMIGIIK
jgi:glycosyltransferase involved in cell wall biosynthesis